MDHCQSHELPKRILDQPSPEQVSMILPDPLRHGAVHEMKQVSVKVCFETLEDRRLY